MTGSDRSSGTPRDRHSHGLRHTPDIPGRKANPYFFSCRHNISDYQISDCQPRRSRPRAGEKRTKYVPVQGGPRSFRSKSVQKPRANPGPDTLQAQ
jgi:hypothetical protein